MPHLVVSISGHGFGHVSQTAPVLNLLHKRLPELRLTVRSAVPLAHLRSRIGSPFEHLPGHDDLGMAMSSALEVRVDESRAAYRAIHANWDERVAGEARLLKELGADMVFSNVGYLALAGAQRAGIPNVAMCSLNWADIYRSYCGEDDAAAQIHACYAGADAFLRATPGMAMDSLPNLAPVAPIAATGENRREELNHHLRLSRDERLVLVSLGGIASRLPVERWPRIEGVRWLVPSSWQVSHPDAIPLESLQMNFGDLLASSDALLCKPGYGSFVEAACCGVPILYMARPGWPEAPALVEWLHRHSACREVSHEALERGGLAGELDALWRMPQAERIRPDGVAQVADWLEKMLNG